MIYVPRSLEELKRRQGMVTRGGTNDLHVTDGAIDDRLFELHEGRIEATLESAKKGETLGLGKRINLLWGRKLRK